MEPPTVVACFCPCWLALLLVHGPAEVAHTMRSAGPVLLQPAYADVDGSATLGRQCVSSGSLPTG
jgi:hypothetical protein